MLKIGIKTSEFWGAAVAWLANLVLFILAQTGGLSGPAAHAVNSFSGLGLVGLPLAYAALRSLLKALDLWLRGHGLAILANVGDAVTTMLPSTAPAAALAPASNAINSALAVNNKPSAASPQPGPLTHAVEPNLVPPGSIMPAMPPDLGLNDAPSVVTPGVVPEPPPDATLTVTSTLQ